MKKTHKKRENALRSALTQACETALGRFAGFIWLTHEINHDTPEQSLQIRCMFDSKDSLRAFLADQGQVQAFRWIIQSELQRESFTVKNLHKISFDSAPSSDNTAF